ncbi:MAG: hypothetical protein GXO58_01165 [Thermodesulfobacteria bacterium]|nr:hypothetical protein [Thermodesulfobacteriota bacterium]
MEITCHSCGKTYSLDESKLPDTGRVFVKCAACNEKIEVSKKRQTFQKPATGTGQQNEEPPVEYFDPDVSTALVYCQEVQARLEIEKKLTDAGFETRSVKDEPELRHYFRYNIFDLVVLYQHGPDPDAELGAITKFINEMPAHMRRKTFVIYVHLAGNRYDLYDAFSRGMDATLNPMDINGLTHIVGNLLEQKKQNYKVFFDCLEKVEESVF